MQRKIAVIGTGYVGLTAGACLAYLGHKVICVDKKTDIILKLQKGEIPIFEPGIGKFLEKYKKNIKYTTNIKKTVKESEIIFIAVGTPSTEEGIINMGFFKKAIREIASNISDYRVIVIKSTVPVGTGEWVKGEIKKYYQGEFSVVSNPEFLSEGRAIKDFLEPDRIIIGFEDQKAKAMILDVYSSISAPKLLVDIKSAELIKYASNAFLATKISFINEIASICEKAGGDITKVAQGIGMDKRIGPHFLRAGIGYGGSCFPKDVDGLLYISNKYQHNFELLRTVAEVNLKQQQKFVEKIKSLLLKTKGDTVCAWGLSFKPNTDDVRKSPAIFIINALCQEEIKVQVYDPIAMENAKKQIPFKNVQFCKNALEATKGADVLILLTEWPEFAEIDFREVKKRMRNLYVLDGRNHLEPEKIKSLGFCYEGIGKK
ncbi:MAG: UDP-glucose/GDP-mannose dehydrogenase family protein [Candidatus Pacebacteria bacterium]|nr:UDP-glucose/GDP-mannose dehydrogenase family protein [Candidatus Paceibacterota bacterium]